MRTIWDKINTYWNPLKEFLMKPINYSNLTWSNVFQCHWLRNYELDMLEWFKQFWTGHFHILIRVLHKINSIIIYIINGMELVLSSLSYPFIVLGYVCAVLCALMLCKFKCVPDWSWLQNYIILLPSTPDFNDKIWWYVLVEPHHNSQYQINHIHRY